jgi:hypothetical protein
VIHAIGVVKSSAMFEACVTSAARTLLTHDRFG